jgi:hypothetical protein
MSSPPVRYETRPQSGFVAHKLGRNDELRGRTTRYDAIRRDEFPSLRGHNATREANKNLNITIFWGTTSSVLRSLFVP